MNRWLVKVEIPTRPGSECGRIRLPNRTRALRVRDALEAHGLRASVYRVVDGGATVRDTALRFPRAARRDREEESFPFGEYGQSGRIFRNCA